MQCDNDFQESLLHKHLRLQHGLKRAGAQKVNRNPEQSPKYDAIQLVVNAKNIANIFARFLVTKFNVMCLQLGAIEITRESMPLCELVSTGPTGYVLKIKSGKVLLVLLSSSYLFETNCFSFL